MIVLSFIEKNRMVTPPKKSLYMEREMEMYSSTINIKTVNTILKKWEYK